MTTKDIAKKYGLDLKEFDSFLASYLVSHPTNEAYVGIWGNSINSNVDKYVNLFRQYQLEKDLNDKEIEELHQMQQAEEDERRKACAEMLITSGFSFDGYKITKYSGYISGDDAISIPRGTEGLFSTPTDVSKSLTDSLVKIRRQAIKELKEAAYDLGCNAVIGVDFDYITLDPETANGSGGTTYLPYVFCVTANGNAVIIEKDE